MSIKLMTQVWECGRWAGSDLVMMLALADFANDNGYCWPSVDKLAKKCRVSSRQAQRIIHSLMDEDNPCLERARTGNGAGNSSMYRIIANNMKKDDAGDTLLDEERMTPVTPLPEKRVTSVVKRVTSKAKKGDTHVTRSIIEPSVKATISILAATAAPPETTQQPAATKEATEHQRYFAKVCEIVGWDYRTITKEQKGQVAQTVGILRDAKYTYDELCRFGKEVWVNDWRWIKLKQHPTLSQLRAEIGKLRNGEYTEAAKPPAPEPISLPPEAKRLRELAERAANGLQPQ